MQRYSESTEFHPILIRIVKRCDGDEIRMECGEILRYGISVASMLIWVRGLSCSAGLPFCLSQTIGLSSHVQDMNVDVLIPYESTSTPGLEIGCLAQLFSR